MIAREIVDRYRTSLTMIGDQVGGGVPDDDVRNAGLLTEARLGEIGGNEVMVYGPGLGRIAVFIDDEGRKEMLFWP